MNLVELRQNLKNYCSRFEAVRLAKNLNQTPQVSLAEIEETASDLFSASTVESLKKISEKSADATETERKARRNLLNISRLGFLKKQTKEISAELENCQTAVRVKFQNENLSLQELLKKIESSAKEADRREIFIRLIEGKNSCADLLLEKYARLEEQTKTTGFENYGKLFEETSEIDFDSFAVRARRFLEQTETVYFRMLAENAIKAGLNEKSLHSADFLFFRKQFEREEIFRAGDLPRLYSKILENFNFSEYKIPNISLKKVSDDSETEAFRPILPEKIVFCIANRYGVANYIAFLRAFGKANLAAWSSKELLDRYPEFVFSPDSVLPRAYGFLFQTLLTDESFLRKTLNVWDEKLSSAVKAENRFLILFEARREALRFILETQIFSESENLESVYELSAEAFSNHLGFHFKKQQMPWEISENFLSSKNSRAVLFAFGLREYFREKYGFDWWQKRKAFEELIDFWSAAEQYKAEEMAQMIGFEMSFDLLAETL